MTIIGGCIPRILVVDDHPAVCARVRALLLSYFFPLEVVCAGTGDDGLALATLEEFQLVLLDLCLPGRSGLEVLREIRKVKPSLPIIVLSSLPESPNATLVQRAGAQGYLSKSALVEGLETALRFVLGDAFFASHHRASSAQSEKRFRQ